MFFWRRNLIRRQVVINLKSEGVDKAISGVLISKSGGMLLIKGATIVEGHDAPVAVPGDVAIERSNIEFYQILPKG